MPYVPPIRILAAASLKEAFEEIITQFHVSSAPVRNGQRAVRGGCLPAVSYGASGVLAKQIEAGAKVDVFVSASPVEVDELTRKGVTIPQTRTNFATNTLVLIASAHSQVQEWSDLPRLRRVAISNPQTVPSGRYARETLTRRKLWESLQGRLVLGENVRQTLTYVANGNVQAGIVFATDALNEKRVCIVARAIPGVDHAPIVYPAVVLTRSGNPKYAQAFVAYLRSPSAQTVLRRYGFGAP